MLKLARDQDFGESKKLLQDLIYIKGIAGSDLLREINQELALLDFSNDAMLSLYEKVAEIDFRLIEGASPDIQIASLLAFIGTLTK